MDPRGEEFRKFRKELNRKARSDPMLHENRVWVKDPRFKRAHTFNRDYTLDNQVRNMTYDLGTIEEVMCEPLYSIDGP
jgi:hypothetical protein